MYVTISRQKFNMILYYCPIFCMLTAVSDHNILPHWHIDVNL